MAYQALYRMWRPAFFSEAVGQENIVKALKNQVQSRRIAHAYLFCGSRGTGKTSFAKIFARAVNCENPQDGDLCGICASCKSSEDEATLDIIEIDAASNNGVEEIRDLREKVKYPPQHGSYKVYIIDEVHMLSASAFNALLKTLEEPPAHVIFILATTEPQKLPATILSRCQRYDFGRHPAVKIAGRLVEAAVKAGTAYTDEAMTMIAVAAEGGLRDALNILDMCMAVSNDINIQTVRDVLGVSDSAFMAAFTAALLESDLSRAIRDIDTLIRAGKEPSVFARDVCRHLRALLLSKSVGDDLAELLETTQEEAAAYRAQAENTSNTRLIKLLELFSTYDGNARYASSPRLALELTAVKACAQTQDVDVAALNERIAQLELQLASLSKAALSGALAAPQNSNPAQNAAAIAVPGAPVQEKTAIEAPKAPPRQPAKPEADDDTSRWNALLKELKMKKPGLFVHLGKGRFLSINEGRLRVAFSEKQRISIPYLSKDTIQAEIGDVYQQLFGSRITLDIMSEDKVTNLDEKKYDALFEAFGRDNVVVRDATD